MLETIPGYDAWKTRSNDEWERELGRQPRAGDPCMCGHGFEEHTKSGICGACFEEETTCQAFEPDLDQIEEMERAEADERAVDDEMGK